MPPTDGFDELALMRCRGKCGSSKTKRYPKFTVRRERRHSSAGANPARQLSLQPVAWISHQRSDKRLP